MANNTVTYTINANGNAVGTVTGLNTQFDQLNQTASRTESLFERIGKVAFNFNNIVGSISNITSKMREFTDANKMQQVAENQLAQVMKNTMGASQDEIDSIKELASAQQQLGVIGDEVQLAGAKELGVHLKKADTMKKLMPVMNDYIAKNYGLDASQESAANAGALLGKAMDGNVMMLERAGIKFSEAQKKIMQTGTEEQRAATLAEVLNEKVGGMNEAMANTPEGKMQQAANSFGDLRERIGAVWTRIQTALLPVFEKLKGKLDNIIGWVEEHEDDIANFVENVAPKILSVAVAIGAVVAVIKTVTAVTRAWTVVQTVINMLMNANPIGLIIAGIVLLIGVIVFLCLKIKGWGTLWDAVCTFCKETFMAYVDGVKLYFETLVSGLLIGLDKIKEGWYKFKLAVGLGDEAENNAALKQIQADIKYRADRIAAAANKEKEHLEKAKHAFDNVSLTMDKTTTLKGTTDKLKAELGLTGEVTENDNGTTITNDLSDASTSISSGGKSVKNFNITINDGLVNGVQNYFNSSDDSPESASDFMRRLSDALQMILNDVNYAAN